MSNFFDTICATATPLSVGGIGIIRVSGDKALEFVQKIFNKKIEPEKICRGWIVFDSEKIDEVVVLYFKSPKSYTGEDVVEIQTHGNPVIIKKILNIILNSGARLAERGEFTKRAFLNGKMDLSEAEAVLDLINSKTAKAASKSAMNLSGALSVKINSMREKIIELLGKITASLDFPEDVAEVPNEEIVTVLEGIKTEIENVLKNASNHNLFREGIKIAVAGRPNAGKSSLFNALLNLDRAIVTDIAGTTRDVITESFEVNGVLATLTDTAGIRDEGSDVVENIGINQAKEAIENADIVLLLYDGTTGLNALDEKIFALARDKKQIIVSTKSDIKKEEKEGVISISSKTGENIEKLKSMIYEKMIDTNLENTDFITNERQQENLRHALLHLQNAISGARQNELCDLISIDIKSALISLDEITGEVVTDEILNSIFDKFCIGK